MPAQELFNLLSDEPRSRFVLLPTRPVVEAPGGFTRCDSRLAELLELGRPNAFAEDPVSNAARVLGRLYRDRGRRDWRRARMFVGEALLGCAA